MKLTNHFVTSVASELVCEVQKAIDEGNRPFAAILFRVPKDQDIGMQHKVGSARNQSAVLHNHTAHAESLLVNREEIAKDLYDTYFNDRANRPIYCIFVNAPPCPMCMGAIINAQILYTYYFVEILNKAQLPLHPKSIAEMYQHRNAFVVQQCDIGKNLHNQLERQIKG